MKLLKQNSLGKLLLRLPLGGLILLHGIHKIFELDSLQQIGQQLARHGLPELLAYGVFLGEIVAPLLIILGIACRLGGLLVFINMLLALFLVHQHGVFSLTNQGGWSIELEVIYLFCGLALLFLGSGRFALKPD
ncbi:DoxX family protein [Dongshaea marina]|uniref:DoxX family protein n=1 Tax=Dongshaea marina TaxID=2047966 RepID=UPI000D3EB711|nr:DoxX family protein [Dongshaea marina]